MWIIGRIVAFFKSKQYIFVPAYKFGTIEQQDAMKSHF